MKRYRDLLFRFARGEVDELASEVDGTPPHVRHVTKSCTRVVSKQSSVQPSRLTSFAPHQRPIAQTIRRRHITERFASRAFNNLGKNLCRSLLRERSVFGELLRSFNGEANFPRFFTVCLLCRFL